MNRRHMVFDRSSRAYRVGDPEMDLCDGGNGRDRRANTKVDGFSTKITVSSLLRAVSGNVTSFTALIAGLANSV